MQTENRKPKTEHRSRLLRAVACLLLACAISSLAGCQYLILAGYLIGGPPTVEPDFDTQTGKSMSEKDVRVLILCYAPTEVKWDFESIDKELMKYVGHRLNQNHISVIRPDAVQAWLDQNADWDKPTEIGADFEATYVVFIELSKFSLYEENASNLYRGRADVIVSVYEMEGDDGHVIYTKELQSEFPKHQPLSTGDLSYYKFKQLYLSRLSEELGWIFYEHDSGADITVGGL